MKTKIKSADEQMDTGFEYRIANLEQNIGRLHGRTGLSWKNDYEKKCEDRPVGGRRTREKTVVQMISCGDGRASGARMDADGKGNEDETLRRPRRR